jgi:hypothetical protein
VKLRTILVVVAVCAVGVVALSYGARKSFENPKTCMACHFIAPYYAKWESSTHNMAPSARSPASSCSSPVPTIPAR